MRKRLVSATAIIFLFLNGLKYKLQMVLKLYPELIWKHNCENVLKRKTLQLFRNLVIIEKLLANEWHGLAYNNDTLYEWLTNKPPLITFTGLLGQTKTVSPNRSSPKDLIENDEEVDVEQWSDHEDSKKPEKSESPSPTPKKKKKEDKPKFLKPKCNAEELLHVDCYLETKELWDKFNELGTEMIITKTGR